MEKEFINYTEALALKELGFDEPCLASWTYKTKERIPTLYGCGALLFDTDGLITNQTEDIICSAPLYQQAFRWFREKYNWIVYLYPYFYNNYQELKGLKPDGYRYITFPYGKSRMYETYEEAELECLKKLIEIVKEK